MKANPTRSALVLIDMENGFVNPQGGHCIRGAASTVPACIRALSLAREKGIPVFFVKRIYRADGSDVELTRYAAWKAPAGRLYHHQAPLERLLSDGAGPDSPAAGYPDRDSCRNHHPQLCPYLLLRRHCPGI